MSRKKSKLRTRKVSSQISRKKSKRNSRKVSRKKSKRNSRRRFKMDMDIDEKYEEKQKRPIPKTKIPKQMAYETQKYIDFNKIQENYPYLKKSLKRERKYAPIQKVPYPIQNIPASEYSGIVIENDFILNNKLYAFNYYLHAYNKDCDNIAYVNNYDANQPVIPIPNNNIFIKPDNKLILVIPTGLKDAIKQNPQMLNNFDYIKPLGMAIIKYNSQLNRVEIYNLCLMSRRESGYGKVLTKILFSTAQEQYPKSNLWLGIDLKNQHFSKVAKLYTKEGFENPKYEEIRNGSSIVIRFIGLTKIYNKTKKSNINEEYNKTMKQYEKYKIYNKFYKYVE